MDGIGKFQNITLGIMFAAQLALLFAGEELLALLIPSLLAAVPLGYLALRSERATKLKFPSIGNVAIVIGLLWGLPAASLLMPYEPAIGFMICRLILIDGGILYAVGLLAIYCHPKNRAAS